MRQIRTKNGKTVTLLNPSEKGGKYADELRCNCKFTNDGNLKTDTNGCVSALSPTEASFRMGYLAAQKDSANCYKANQKKNRKGLIVR